MKYSKTNKAIKLKPSAYPLLTLITDRTQKRPVTDVEFKTFSAPFPTTSGQLWGYSAGSKAALTASNDFYIVGGEKFLCVGDMLKLSGLDANNTGTKTILGELARVTGTPAANYVTMARNIASGTAVANSDSGGTGIGWTFAGAAEPLGGASRTGKSIGLGSRTNYVRSFCEPYAIVDIMQDLDYLGPNELQRMREDALIRLQFSEEHMLLYGKKLRETDGLGRYVYNSAGLQHLLNTADTEEGIAAWTTGASGTDLVNGDGTSRVWRPQANFTLPLIEKFLERAFRYGNLTKLGLHGSAFMRCWRNQWGDKIQMTERVTDYGITINSHTVDSYKINFVYCPAMDKEDPTGLFLTDLPYVWLAVINDIHPRDEIQDKKARTKEYDYIADVGADVQFLKAHSYIKDLNDIV